MTTRKPLKRPLGDTEYLLEQWGWWRMDGRGIPQYVSSLQVLMRQHVAQSGECKPYCISDELAGVIDAAVARLTRRDQQMGDFIWLYFGAKWPMLRLGRHCGISESKAREVVRAGVAWIDCVLETLRRAA